MKSFYLCLCVCALAALAVGEEDCETALKAAKKAYSDLASQFESGKAEVARLTNDLETKAAELEKVRLENGEIKKELEAKTKSCSFCESELRISKGAEKQMGVELKNAFARINILGSDNDNLEKAYDQLKEDLEEKEKKLQAAVSRVEEAEAALEASKAKGKGSFVPMLVEVSTWFSPYWQSLRTQIQPAIDFAMTSPYVAQAIDYGRQSTEVAVSKINQTYRVAKPRIMQALRQAQAWLRTKYVELSESKTVGQIISVVTESFAEMKDWIQAQMASIPSLQPFAKTEYVVFIAYSIISLPPLFLAVVIMTWMSYRAGTKKEPPTGSASKSKKKKAKKASN